MNEYAVIDPATNEVVERYGQSTDADIQHALASAENAYRTFSKKTSVAERAKMMSRVAELHAERVDELARIVVQEMGNRWRRLSARSNSRLRFTSTTRTTPKRSSKTR